MLLWTKRKATAAEAYSAINESYPALSSDEIRRFIADIPCGAELHRRHIEDVFKVAMDYSAESLGDLDTLIARHWPKPPVHLDDIIHEFGCYVGHTIRRLHGGEWSYTSDCGWMLKNIGGQDIKIFPFAKVRRRFLLGKEESLSTYYSFIRSQTQTKSDDLEVFQA